MQHAARNMQRATCSAQRASLREPVENARCNVHPTCDVQLHHATRRRLQRRMRRRRRVNDARVACQVARPVDGRTRGAWRSARAPCRAASAHGCSTCRTGIVRVAACVCWCGCLCAQCVCVCARARVCAFVRMCAGGTVRVCARAQLCARRTCAQSMCDPAAHAPLPELPQSI